MRAYSTMDEKKVLYKLPMVRGWAYYAFAVESEPFCSAKRAGAGYVAQEIESRKAALIPTIKL